MYRNLFNPDEVTLPPEVRVLVARSEDEDRWHEERDKLVCTGSSSAAKLGVSPFPKDREEPDEYQERLMQVGSMLEGAVLADPCIQKMLAEHPPWAGAKLYWNEDDWLMADNSGLGTTPDGMMVKGSTVVGAVEVKFVSASWQGREPPAYYRVQAAMTADILGADDYAVAAWQQGASGVMWPYVRFGKVSDGIPVRGKTMEWHRVRDVLTGAVPSPEPHDSPVDGLVTADTSLRDALDELREARALRKEGEDREKAVKEEIFARIGKKPVEIVDENGNRIGEITQSTTKRFNTKVFQEAHPNLYEDFRKENITTRIKA